MIVQVEKAGPTYDLTRLRAELTGAYIHDRPLDDGVRIALLNLIGDLDFLTSWRGIAVVRKVT